VLRVTDFYLTANTIRCIIRMLRENASVKSATYAKFKFLFNIINPIKTNEIVKAEMS